MQFDPEEYVEFVFTTEEVFRTNSVPFKVEISTGLHWECQQKVRSWYDRGMCRRYSPCNFSWNHPPILVQPHLRYCTGGFRPR